MNTPQTPHHDDALTDDERQLASRLSLLGGPREPSAALDAAILAAARAAVDGDALAGKSAAAQTVPVDVSSSAPDRLSAEHKQDKVVPLPLRKPKPRWPLGLSLAASLVLAAGIGIKLYDDGLSYDTAESASAAAESAEAFGADSAEPLAEAVLIDPPLQRESPPPPPPLEDGFAASPRQAHDTGEGLASVPQASAAIAEAEADAMGAMMAEEAPALSAPPPAPVAARSAEPAAPPVAAEQDSLDRITVTGSRAGGGDARSIGAAEHTRTPLSDRRREATEAARDEVRQRESAKSERRAASAMPAPPRAPSPAVRPAPSSASANTASSGADAGSGFALEPPSDKAAADTEDAHGDYDDRPPVTADSPEFRQAWLQRIRKLVADGRRVDARESLLEFRRRYPDVLVPDDLRPLLAPEPLPPAR